MFIAQMPAQEIVDQTGALVAKLKQWDPDIDATKLVLIEFRPVVWNDGSLGCPMPGMCYTMALVPGYLICYYYLGHLLEVHTNEAMSVFAMPGQGFI